MLEYAHEDPVHRRWQHNLITFSMLYMLTENFVLPFSHDEVVHGKGAMLDKMPGDVVAEARDAARALRLHVRRTRARSCCSWAASSASGASGTTIAASTGICSTIRRTPALRRYVQALNWHYRAEPALHERDFEPGGFRWIDCNDNENSVVSLVRYARDRDDFVVMVFNFTPVPRARLPHRRARARAGTPSC